MPKVLIDGNLVDVPVEALLADDGTTPLNLFTPGQHFTEQDIARVRSEEKDKLYPQITALKDEISGLRENFNTLSAAEQQRLQDAEAEKKRLEAEARAAAEKDMEPKDLVARQRAEFDAQLAEMNSRWETQVGDINTQLQTSEAVRAKERTYHEVREYAQAQAAANQEKIAPQLLPYVGGDTKEQVDASIVQAIATTDAIQKDLEEAMQQFQPSGIDPATGQFIQAPVVQQPPTVSAPAYAFPNLVGVRPASGPVGIDPAGQQTQQLTAQQIADMPMDQWAKIRGNLGIGGQGNNRGMYG